MSSQFKTPKSRETFERILAVSIRLFREKGFNGVSMRDISREGELSLGSLYYYFQTKEELVLLFYIQINDEIQQAFWESQDDIKKLPVAFKSYMTLKIKILTPYRDLLKIVIKEAVDPDSLLCPLGKGSNPTRLKNTDFFQSLIEKSGTESGEQARRMARALWVLHMGVIGYWLHDRSKDYKATGMLIDLLGDMLKWSAITSKIPGFDGLRIQVLNLLEMLLEGVPDDDGDRHAE